MARKERQYEDDDGRTIVNMNVEGMPWYDRNMRREQRKQQNLELKERIARGEALTTRETIRATFYALLGGLTVFGVIAGGSVLFIFILWLLWK